MNGYHRLSLAKQLMENADEYYDYKDYYRAAAELTQAIEICPWSSYLRSLRAKCRMQLGDYAAAVLDIRSTTKLTSDNTDGYFELSSLLYQLGLVQDSLK